MGDFWMFLILGIIALFVIMFGGKNDTWNGKDEY